MPSTFKYILNKHVFKQVDMQTFFNKPDHYDIN